MNRSTYESLKDKDYNEAVYYFMNMIRGDLPSEDFLPNIVAAATIAFLMKDGKDSSEAVNYLKDRIDNETTVSFLKKVRTVYSTQIEDFSKKFDSDTLKATALFSEPKLFSAADINSTPEGIANLAISLLHLTVEDIVLDLGSGVSSFLIQASQKSSSEKGYGVEINTNNVIVSNLRLFIMDLPYKIIQGNMISQEFNGISANKVFSNYPLGMKYSSLEKYVKQNGKLRKYFKQAKRTVSGDWVFGLASYLSTKENGRTVVLMSNAGTWNKPDEFIRRKLVEDGQVEGVISLPPRLLSSTMIPLTMMILSQDNQYIKMVDATEIYTEGRRQNSLEENDIAKILEAYNSSSGIGKRIKIDEVAKQEFILNPQRYIGVDSGIENGISLGDLSLSINRGSMIKSNDLDELISTEETNFHYLMLQNIQDGLIDSNLPNLISIDKTLEKYCINDKNLIISKISPFKVAMAHVKSEEVILANGNLYFIELDEEKVNPVFVQLFLQSEIGMSQLNRLSKGTVMKSISIQDLKTVQIPNISKEKQDLIAEEYENINDELVILQRQMDMIKDKRSRILEGEI